MFAFRISKKVYPEIADFLRNAAIAGKAAISKLPETGNY